MLKITTPETAPPVSFQLDGRIMLSRPGTEVIQLSLKPGEFLPKHVNDFDVAIYILEGQGRIETGTASKEVLPGMLAEIVAGEERGMANTGDGMLKVLVMKFVG
jgi:quercetin dioxygenase-like cupin family protein